MLVCLVIGNILALASCTPTSDHSVVRVPQETPFDAVGPSVAVAALRGDPSFAPDRLDPSMRSLHARLWATLDHPEHRRSIRAQASSDDVFTYGRTLGGHLLSVLAAFRVTGDLMLLDYVDEVTQLMRSTLADGWRGTNDGSDGTRDGFLNWVYRYYETPSFQGKDTRVIDEIQAHAIIAHVAFTYSSNADLLSPSGVDYGERAAFWQDYLVNHFEAKWRERNDASQGFPFITRTQTTTYYAWTRWHYYMWRLTNDDAYGREAHVMADNLWAEIRVVEADCGDAYVWASGLLELGDNQRRIQPTNYASGVYGSIVDFHLEGFHGWAESIRMEAFACTFAAFVIDSDEPEREGLAPDIGGGVPRAGLRNDSSSIRRTLDWFKVSLVGLMAAWDAIDGSLLELVEVTEALYGQEDDTSRLTTALLVAQWHALGNASARAD